MSEYFKDTQHVTAEKFKEIFIAHRGYETYVENEKTDRDWETL